MSLKRVLRAAAAVAALAILSAPALAVDKIGVTYVTSPLNVPTIVERKLEIFSKAFDPLPVEYSNLTAGPEQTQALASGDLQFLNAVGGTSVILAASNGLDIVILSMYSRSPEAFCLFGGKDSNVSSAADLKGKKIAGPKGTNLHELLVSYLATAGLTEQDVQFLSMPIPSAQAALVAGEVDFALAAGPIAYNISAEGYKLVTNGTGLVDATIVTAASRKFCDENPELVAKFLAAQAETLAWIEANYDEMVPMVMEATSLPEEAVKAMYPMYNFSSAITDQDLASLERTAKFMADNAMIDQIPDIRGLVY